MIATGYCYMYIVIYVVIYHEIDSLARLQGLIPTLVAHCIADNYAAKVGTYSLVANYYYTYVVIPS